MRLLGLFRRILVLVNFPHLDNVLVLLARIRFNFLLGRSDLAHDARGKVWSLQACHQGFVHLFHYLVLGHPRHVVLDVLLLDHVLNRRHHVFINYLISDQE